MFVEWTDNNGTLAGTLQTAKQSLRTTPGVTISSDGFTGIRADNRVTLTIPAGLGFGTTLSGTVDGSTLTLFMPNQQGVTTPYTFRAATLTDFNRAIAALRQQDEELRSTQATAAAEVRAIQATAAAEARAFQATATTEAKKQAAVRDANATLASAIRLLSDAGDRLKRDTNYDAALKQYAADWALMQTEYTKLQSEAAKRPFDCYQLGTVKYQLGTVQYVHGSIKYDRSSFDYVVKTVSNDISDVQKNMQAVRDAWVVLQRAVAANATGTPSAQFNQEAIDRALGLAQQQLDNAATISKSAQDQATSYDAKAADLDKTAVAFVAGLKCSN
ncbi:MAG: hypothetical protein U0841_22165 [Chloroflexia bacterium]